MKSVLIRAAALSVFMSAAQAVKPNCDRACPAAQRSWSAWRIRIRGCAEGGLCYR
jgi:hypothetical protein